MPEKSQESGSLRVAKTQHQSSTGTPRIPTTRDVLERIGDYAERSGYPSTAAALEQAGIDGPDFHRALKTNAPLSASDAKAVAGIASSPDLRAQFEHDLRQAFLWHRAAILNVPFHHMSPVALINGTATTNKRISAPRDYWMFLLFCVMQSCGKEPAPVTASNLPMFIADLVDAPRRVLGEPAALTNALILAHACLHNLPADRNSGVMLLTVVVAAFDLAAQVNNVFVETRLIQILERHVRPLLSDDAERCVYDCIIRAYRATAIRHGKTFRAESAAAAESHTLTREALQAVTAARRQLGFAADHPRLRQCFEGASFQIVQTAKSAGLPHGDIDDFIAFHDETGNWFLPPGAVFEPLGTAPAPGERAKVYRLDMLAELWLHRPDRDRTLAAKPDRHWRFDPDQALDATSMAIAGLDPQNAAADTAYASVYMTHAEALLCRHARDATDRGAVRRWTGSEREEYRLARERAVEAFTRLNMAWKLRQLAGQELRAGIDAQEWGMRVLHRSAPKTAASVAAAGVRRGPPFT
jgi:hypothetical protein